MQPTGKKYGPSFEDMFEDIPKKKEEPKTEPKKICGFCAKENPEAKLCGRCKLVCYCNEDCQSKAWKIHKTICKPPTHTSFKLTQGTLDNDRHIHTSSKGNIVINTWGQEQTSSTGAKDVSKKFSTKAQQKISGNTETEGISINNFTNNQDVINFAFGYSPEKIKELKKQHFNGLKELDKEKAKSFIENQNYIAILKYLWTEDDLDYKIEWLKPLAEAGHAILMLELFRALCQKASKQTSISEKESDEAIKWYLLGMHCTYLDLACNNDSSTMEAVNLLTQNYFQIMALLPEAHRVKYNDYSARKEIISKWKPDESHPSPQWVIYGGLEILSGTIALKEKEKWLDLRKQKHQERLNSSDGVQRKTTDQQLDEMVRLLSLSGTFMSK